MARIRKSVLIVDTNMQMQELLASLTVLQGIVPYICPKTVSPISHARRLGVDGVLLSVDVPLMPWLDLIGAFRHHKDLAHLPLLIVTALGLDKDLKTLKEGGCKNILLKPFSIDKIEKFFKDFLI